jgi:hypothetical protein
MSDIIVFDQWVNPIQDLGGYGGPEKDSNLLFTTMNNKTQDLNLTITKSKGDDSVVVISDLVDRQPVSHQSIGPKYLTKSCLQSKLDQDDVKIIAPKIPSKVCIQRAATQSNTILLNGKRFMCLSTKTYRIPVWNRS